MFTILNNTSSIMLRPFVRIYNLISVNTHKQLTTRKIKNWFCKKNIVLFFRFFIGFDLTTAVSNVLIFCGLFGLVYLPSGLKRLVGTIVIYSEMKN